METYSVDIINPKATKLLQDLADLELIVLRPASQLPAPVTDDEKARARERIMRGAPTLNVEEMLTWLEESKKDQKLPFRDDE